MSDGTIEFSLLAMARNYSDRHSWDHLDSEVCRRAAAEIIRLRALTDDAARYQHLVATCNIDHDPSEPWQLVIWEPATGEDWKAKLDAAIDSARASTEADAIRALAPSTGQAKGAT